MSFYSPGKKFLLYLCWYAWWMIWTVHATIEFKPGRLQVSQNSFTSYLLISPPVAENSISVSCQASVVASLADVETTPNCAFTSNVAGTITPPKSPWQVENSRFDIPALESTTQKLDKIAVYFKIKGNTVTTIYSFQMATQAKGNTADSSQSYLPVTTERATDPTAKLVEIVVTTCCVLGTSLNPNYRGNSSIVVAVANVAPYFCADCNDTLANPTAERTIQNPGYVEIGPCPCDLKENECDFGCSCDSECTDNNKARFGSTIAGLLGGQNAEFADYECDTKTFNLPDWHPLTCVYWESNAYLGLYYMNKAKLTSSGLNSASTKYSKNKFTFAESEQRNVDKDYSRQEYQQGSILQTQIVSNAGYTGTLSLPQTISGGACNPLAPVRYLMPFESSCASQLTTQTCSSLSTFDIDVYAMTNATATNFRILNRFSGGSSFDSEVTYYCLGDISAYQPSSTSPLGSQSSTTVSNFPDNLQNEQCFSSCDNPTCSQYNVGKSYPESVSLPGACTGPTPVTALDGTSNVCNNAVLEVRYTFFWFGPEIRKLEATVIVANVAGVNAPKNLVQKFSVQWQHILNVTNPPLSDNYLNLNSAYSRSGNVGYEIGKPLYTGCATENPTGQFANVDIQDEKQIAIWRPGVDGLCANARRQFLTFGDDAVSSCALRLTFKQLHNTTCAELRQLISNHLNVLMTGDVIGRYGYNDQTNETMWIPILRQNLSAIEIPTPPPITDDPSDNITVFHRKDDIQGICFVPTAINLNVLFAQTGAVFGHPRYEVVGAYINYTHNNWSMECMGANSQRCDATSGLVQNVFLHSSVRFIQIPPQPPSQDSRFYTKFDLQTCDTDTCNRFRADFARDECYFDTCWHEFVYPLTSEYQGDKKEYALAVFLLIVLGIVGYASVTKPGWS